MKISDKYIIKEDKDQITLFEVYDRKVKDKATGEYTGETVKHEKNLGYYPILGSGRAIAYKRIINNEITQLEEQTLEKILEVVEKTSKEILEWFKEK